MKALIDRPDVRLLDLPGTYSLAAHSPDETVARDVLLGRLADTPRPDAVLIVMDAANLERNLYLATQVLDLCIPAVLACNMMDSVRHAGQELDINALSAALGVPVVGTVGSTGEGLDALRAALLRLQQTRADRPCTCIWARRWRATEAVEAELHRVAAELRSASSEQAVQARVWPPCCWPSPRTAVGRACRPESLPRWTRPRPPSSGPASMPPAS